MSRVENTSGIRPLGRVVLVEYYIPEQAHSVIAIPDHIKDRTNSVEQRARVIAIGPSCWPDESPRAVEGDYVLISHMAGYAAKGPLDDKPYRLVNDRDIFAGFSGAAVAAMKERHNG